jgi:hypothetical protein
MASGRRTVDKTNPHEIRWLSPWFRATGCRGYNTHIHRNTHHTSDAADFLFLEHTQKLALQRKRCVPDLIQKNRPLMRFFKKAASPALFRTGKRPSIYPNNSLSARCSGMAARLIATNAFPPAPTRREWRVRTAPYLRRFPLRAESSLAFGEALGHFHGLLHGGGPGHDVIKRITGRITARSQLMAHQPSSS